MSSKYPSLDRIGITEDEAHLIKRYSIRQQGNSDVVKIYFHRKPHSFMSHNRKFVFERTSKSVLVDGGRQIYENVYEISPFIESLMNDLTKIEAESTYFLVGKKKVLNDLEHLRKVVDQKILEIEKELEKLS